MNTVDRFVKRTIYAFGIPVKTKHLVAFCRYNTYLKFRNLLKVEAAKRFRWRKAGFGYPYLLTVEPTNICNLHCYLCPTGRGQVGRPKGHMDMNVYKKIIDEVGPYVYLINFQNWGEPTLGRHVIDMIDYAHKANIYTAIQTNGNYPEWLNEPLVKAGLDHICLAVDGSTQEIYETYRIGGKLDHICANITNLLQIRKKLGRHRPFVEIQFLVFNHNRDDLNGIRLLARQLRVDGILIRAANGSGNEENRRRFYTWHNHKGFCTRFFYTAIIASDGGVSPCCNYFHQKDDYGNVTEAPNFAAVWDGPVYRKYREAVLRNKPSDLPAICQACKIYNREQSYDPVWEPKI